MIAHDVVKSPIMMAFRHHCMSDDDAARDDTSEVAEVLMPRIVDEYPCDTAAEALVDLWQSDRPVAYTAVVVAQSDPAGRAVDAEVEAAPSRLRKTQRTRVPRRWHLCDAPAQVARTAVAVDAPQHDAVDDAAAAAAMMDVDAEVEAAPPPRREESRFCCVPDSPTAPSFFDE